LATCPSRASLPLPTSRAGATGVRSRPLRAPSARCALPVPRLCPPGDSPTGIGLLLSFFLTLCAPSVGGAGAARCAPCGLAPVASGRAPAWCLRCVAPMFVQVHRVLSTAPSMHIAPATCPCQRGCHWASCALLCCCTLVPRAPLCCVGCRGPACPLLGCPFAGCSALASVPPPAGLALAAGAWGSPAPFGRAVRHSAVRRVTGFAFGNRLSPAPAARPAGACPALRPLWVPGFPVVARTVQSSVRPRPGVFASALRRLLRVCLCRARSGLAARAASSRRRASSLLAGAPDSPRVGPGCAGQLPLLLDAPAVVAAPTRGMALGRLRSC